jgi:hypothetical protein
MSYDTPQREVYVIPSSAFGAATDSVKFVGPPGKTGLVRDIAVEVTASMVGTTTVPEVQVGTAQADFTYARFRLGTTLILGYLTGVSVRARSLCATAQGVTGSFPPALNDFASHVALETVRLPADTPFFISGVLGVGGAPAGTARREVTIDWY